MRALRWISFMVVLAGLAWRFPLFHVVPLQQAVAEKKAATFDPTQFAGKPQTATHAPPPHPARP